MRYLSKDANYYVANFENLYSQTSYLANTQDFLLECARNGAHIAFVSWDILAGLQ